MATIDQWKGSRLRCVLLSGLAAPKLKMQLTRMISTANAKDPKVEIRDDFVYYPQGYKASNEVRLGDASPLLDDNRRKALIKWWLDIEKDTSRQTPNWDFACSALIHDEPGLILIEAKAHMDELIHTDPCKAEDEKSRDAIKLAIEWTNKQLNGLKLGRFAMDIHTHYQISNRFAWSWKLASLGVPVVLIYLGFLHTTEMKKRILESHDDWVKIMRDYSKDLVPEQVWGGKLQTEKKAVYPLICSMNIQPQGKIESINGN